MSALEAALREQEARSAAEQQAVRAAALEERHRSNDAALAAVSRRGNGQVLLCTGKEAFVSLNKEQAKAMLEKENARLWGSVDDAQRRLHILENQAERAGELAETARRVEREKMEEEKEK